MLLKQHFLIFFLVSSIYFLNDFLFIAFKSWQSWLAIDYISRILSLLIVLFFVPKKFFYLNKTTTSDVVFYSFILTIFGTAIIHLIDKNLYGFFEFSHFIKFPKIENEFFNYFDLYIGLILVAISEEIIFRGYFFALFKNRLTNQNIIFFSSLFFALIHWGSGLDAVIGAFLWGVLAMVILLRTNSIIPTIIAHYFTNLILFSDILD